MNFRDPEEMNELQSLLLRYGVVISGAVITLGFLLLFLEYPFADSSSFLAYYPNRLPHGNYDVGLGGIASGVLTLNPFSTIELGFLVLLATPVVRVASSAFLFAAEGNRTYAYVAAGVLTLLLFSIILTPYIPGFNPRAG